MADTGTTKTDSTNASNDSTIGSILLQGLIAALVASVVNVFLSLILRNVLDIDDAFEPLRVGPVITMTMISVLLGTGVYLLLRRFVKRPNRVFTIVALGTAAVSCFGPITMLNSTTEEYPGLTDAAALSLIPLHILPALIVVAALTRNRQARR